MRSRVPPARIIAVSPLETLQLDLTKLWTGRGPHRPRDRSRAERPRKPRRMQDHSWQPDAAQAAFGSARFPVIGEQGPFMSNTPSARDCYFCRVSRGETDPFVFENRSFIGVFDTNPVNPGHALVVPRRHVVSLFELNDEEQADYFDALQGVKRVIEATDLADLYREMLGRDYLQDRPKDHIEAVLRLEFLGRKPDAYTIGNNDGREAGRSIDHLHVILLPRYSGDVDNPRGGIRNVIPGRAHYQRR